MQVRSALADKDAALKKTDQALERVRETNEILRQSEEHLRLIFDAAVDGVAELDERGVVLRANEALCRMVGLDRGAIEQQPWSALAAVVTGADERFAALPNAVRRRSSATTASRCSSSPACRRSPRRPLAP